jgi:hypothetical protein
LDDHEARDRCVLLRQEVATLRAEVDRMAAERDAAIAVAIHAGKSTFGLTDDQACQLIGRSFKAWLDPDSLAAVRPLAAAVRRSAGLG